MTTIHTRHLKIQHVEKVNNTNVRNCRRQNVELINMLRFYIITSKFIHAVNVEYISWKLPTDLTEFKSPSFLNKLKHRIAGWETDREF